MIRSVITATAIIFLTLVLSAGGNADVVGSPKPKPDEPGQLLEPIVKRHLGIISPDACKELIALGEEEGFTVENESIDDYEDEKYKTPSQSIEVFNGNDGFGKCLHLV